MSLNVETEMVRPGESSAAVWAVEWFVSRVFPQMSRQLVRPHEGPATAVKITDEGSLACVDPLVSLQVGVLLVALMTVWEVTLVTLSILLLFLPPQTLQGSDTFE